MKPRSMPPNVRVRKALESYMKMRTDEFEEDLLLGQRGPLSEWGIHAIVKKYANQTRQEEVTAHTLHHNSFKNLVDAGAPLDQVAVILGHQSLDTTRIYTQPSQRDLERAVLSAAGEVVDE